MNELREFTYPFFSNIAVCLGRDIKPHLDTLMPFIVAGLETSEGIDVKPTEGGAFGSLVEDSPVRHWRNTSIVSPVMLLPAHLWTKN